MKDIKAIKGKYYIQRLIDEGEHLHQDFKYAISDAPKIAHSISAFANADGGRLLVGVKDNGNIAGIRSEEEVYMIEQAAQSYCHPPQEVAVTAFACEGGAVVLRAEIQAAATRPVYSIDTNGRRKAYIRVADENIAAHPLMVRAWQMKSDSSRQLTLSDAEHAILSLIATEGALSPEECSLKSHLSRRSASDAIAALASADLIEFRYTESGFVIAMPSS